MRRKSCSMRPGQPALRAGSRSLGAAPVSTIPAIHSFSPDLLRTASPGVLGRDASRNSTAVRVAVGASFNHVGGDARFADGVPARPNAEGAADSPNLAGKEAATAATTRHVAHVGVFLPASAVTGRLDPLAATRGGVRLGEPPDFQNDPECGQKQGARKRV